MPGNKVIMFILIPVLLSCSAFSFGSKYEKDYQRDWCQGEIEVKLHDKTRVDCLTNTHAIEIDWCHKWAEGVGQALYYSKVTGRKAGLALICSASEINRFVDRVKLAAPEIDVFIIDKVGL